MRLSYLRAIALLACAFPVGERAIAQESSAIEVSYYQAFCRGPTTEEAGFWQSQRNRGDVSELVAAHREWLKQQPSERAKVVRRAYAVVLGRVPSEKETRVLSGASTGTICVELLSELFDLKRRVPDIVKFSPEEFLLMLEGKL